MTKNELRRNLNDAIVVLSEALVELESADEEETMKRIDARAAELEKSGMTKGAAYEKAGVEVLGPIEKAKRQAERAERAI